jgi:hypothetical protein
MSHGPKACPAAPEDIGLAGNWTIENGFAFTMRCAPKDDRERTELMAHRSMVSRKFPKQFFITEGDTSPWKIIVGRFRD